MSPASCIYIFIADEREIRHLIFGNFSLLPFRVKNHQVDILTTEIPGHEAFMPAHQAVKNQTGIGLIWITSLTFCAGKSTLDATGNPMNARNF